MITVRLDYLDRLLEVTKIYNSREKYFFYRCLGGGGGGGVCGLTHLY